MQGLLRLPVLRGHKHFRKPAAGLSSPAPGLKVKAPFAITVQFVGQADSPIDPATFQVFYGALKIDITSRITRFVKVTKEGFSLENAQIPSGKHRVSLQVQDEEQRLAERELRVEVE